MLFRSAAITGASTIQFSSAVISAVHGARVNGQYPTGELVFSTSTSTNSAPTEKVRIAKDGAVGIGYTSLTGVGSSGLAVLGNVGIGTSSPVSRLTLQGASTTNPTSLWSFGYIPNGTIDQRCGTIRNAFDANTSYSTYWTAWRGANGASYKAIFGIASGSGDKDLLSLSNTGACVWTPDGTTSAMTLDANGNLLVGTTGATSQKFKVQAATNVCLGMASGTMVSGALTLNAMNDASTANVPLDIRCSQLYVSSGITAGAGSYPLKTGGVNGAITYDTSSARYKNNIRDSAYGLLDVIQLRSAMFEYKNTGRTDIGLIAEEVFDVIPELVILDGQNRPDAVSYDRFVSVLVKSIQELHAEIETLKQRIK